MDIFNEKNNIKNTDFFQITCYFEALTDFKIHHSMERAQTYIKF